MEEGAAVVLAPCGQGPVVIHRHWGGNQVSYAAHTSRHSSQSAAGLRALGLRGSSGDAGGSRTRWTPIGYSPFGHLKKWKNAIIQLACTALLLVCSPWVFGLGLDF